MKHLGRLWRGELTLDSAFWNWAVIGGLVINAASSAAFIVLVMTELQVAALIVGYAFSVPYNIVAAVGVWRSADGYEGDPRWAELARIVTVGGMILLSIT